MLIAAAATARGFGVLHDDRHFDALGQVLHFESVRSRSRLIRDLALRGARARQDESERYGQAVEHLRGIALGEVDYDFAESRAAHAQRESR